MQTITTTKWHGWYSGLALFVTAAVVYVPALGGHFVLDDDDYLTNSVPLRSLDGLRQIWFQPGALPDYYPLTHTTFWVQYHLWGLEPLGYHVVNVLLHAGSVLLLWRLLARLCLPGAWLAAAIFAVHPICVESVAWISELKNVLSMFLVLASMLCYLHFEPPESMPDDAPRSNDRWKYYIAAMLLFTAALLSKTAVVALPAVLLLIYWWKRGRVAIRILRPLVPLFAIALVMSAITVWIETQFNGARGAEWSFSLLNRWVIAGRALCFYASKLIWPHPLAFIYPRWTIDDALWWQYLFPVATIATAIVLWKAREKIGRGSLAATAIYTAVLLPVLGLFNVCFMRYSFVADHFQYHAAPALIAIITAGGCRLFAQLESFYQANSNRLILSTNTFEFRRNEKLIATATVAAFLGALMILSWCQSGLYADAITLYSDTVEKNPDCWMAHYNLGKALIEANRPLESTAQFEITLQLKPDCAEAHNNLAIRLASTGKLPEAIEHYRQAIAIQPDMADAHRNLAIVLFDLGCKLESVQEFEEAIKLQPSNADLWANLASAYAEIHRDSSAVSAAQKSIEVAQQAHQWALAKKVEAWLANFQTRITQRSSATTTK